MAICELRDGTEIGDYRMPYIVAEVNSSHNGNVETAKQMIREAKSAGCDCVKFQSWSAESLYSKTYYEKNPIAKRIVGKFALAEQQLAALADCCKENGIAFSSTPYSVPEVDFLVEKCGAPYIKIASMDINNLPFVRYIAETGVPIVLSTGMADLSEVRAAVETIEKTGNERLCLLHCISLYPVEAAAVRLNNIIGLRENFPQYPIGFSDHTLGTEMAAAATALGAAVIEKHFTLDKKKMGMDNNMAVEPEELRAVVRSCRTVYTAMGERERVVTPGEMEQRKNMRRSIVAARDIKAGEVLCREDMALKRPGTGIAPDRLEDLTGRRALRDIEADTIMDEKDLG